MSHDNSLSHKLLNGGFIILFFSVVTSPLGYLIRMLLSRSLTIEMYGLLYAVLSFISIFTMFNDLGFGFALTYFVPKYFAKKDYAKCWNLYKYDQYLELATSLLISVVLILSSDMLATHFFKHPDSKTLIYLFTFYLVGNGIVSSVQKLLIGLQQEIYYSSIEFFRMLFTFLFTLLFFLFDVHNILFFAASFVSAYIFLTVFYTLLVRIKFGYIKSKLEWDSILINKSFRYGFPTFLSTSLFTIISYTDVLFLTYFRDISTVGVYNVVLPIASISIFLFDPIRKMIVPVISQFAENDAQKVGALISSTFRLIPFIGLYFGLFLLLFSEGIISMTFGYKWVHLASNYLRVMSITYIFSLLSIYLSSVISGLGKAKEQLIVSIFLAVLSLIGAMLGAKFFGLFGIVISNCIVFLSSTYLYYRIIKNHLTSITIPYKLYAKLILLSVCFIIVKVILGFVPISVLSIFISGIIYTAIMFVVFLRLEIIDANIIFLYKNNFLATIFKKLR